MEEPVELYGIVNGALYADDLATAVSNAQAAGKKTVYIPAREEPYYLDASKVIDIYTPGFTLAGAGVGNTILSFSKTCTNSPSCGIYVHPQSQSSPLIEGVRLVGFTMQMESGGAESDPIRQGGIYLENCHGAMVERVNAHGWKGNPNDPANPGYGFRAYNSRAESDSIVGDISFYRCGGVACFYGIWLDGVQPVYRCSIIGASFSAPRNPTGPSIGYGICIQQAKGTLVLGGEFNAYQYGLCLSPGDSANNDVQLTQIYGVKFTGVTKGVYIGSGVQKTQVFGATRSGDINQIADIGTDSLIVSHHADDPYQNNALVLTHQHRSQFSRGVDVVGLADAAALDGLGAGIRTYKTSGDELTKSELDVAFGDDTLPGFVGIYQIGQSADIYLAVKGENGEWFSSSEDSPLVRVTTP